MRHVIVTWAARISMKVEKDGETLMCWEEEQIEDLGLLWLDDSLLWRCLFSAKEEEGGVDPHGLEAARWKASLEAANSDLKEGLLSINMIDA